MSKYIVKFGNVVREANTMPEAKWIAEKMFSEMNKTRRPDIQNDVADVIRTKDGAIKHLAPVYKGGNTFEIFDFPWYVA
jgi:hypothetical protein